MTTYAPSIAKGSKSFAAASRLFDRETRLSVVMLYAWCRHCDDVVDGQEAGSAVMTPSTSVHTVTALALSSPATSVAV